MAAYSYSAINADGLELSGELHAPDLSGAREQLRIRGLLANRLDELPSAGDDSARNVFKKVKPKTLQIFSRQFATMIEAGLNVVQALVILEEQTEDAYFGSVVRELRADVEGGLLLSQAMSRHPKIFERLFISMVEAGEAAGILDETLDRVAVHIEKATQIKRRVKGAMLYPSMVLIFATLTLTGLLLFLVPVFVKIFGQLGGQLPTLTQYVVDVSDLLRQKYYIIFPVLGALIFGLRKYKKTDAGRKKWDQLKLKIPMKIGSV
ncbi:MAG: type II secretion system F family protein, partial [Gaiellaceae bacterium]